MTRAVVLGGGVAGLTAAFLLRERGLEVTLLESRGWFGGRAFSFADRTSGAMLDNGPHVMLGCYRAMRSLLQRLGAVADFLAPKTLQLGYRLSDGRAARLRLLPGPVPATLPLALLGLPLGTGGRFRALRGLFSALRKPPADWSLARWLGARGQSGGPADYLWLPLCRAMMNASPDEVSAALFLETLREAFTGSGSAAAIWVPKRPWSEILDRRARTALPAAGIALQSGARVTGLPMANGRIAAVQIGDGGQLAVGNDGVVISALPWHALAKLLPDGTLPAAALQGSPIVSAHFALAASVAPLPDDGPVTALVRGAPFHFLCRTPGADPRRFALLAGGGRDLDGMQVGSIETLARQQLARHYPGFSPDCAATVRISKEASATFLAAPGSLALRPAPGRLPGGPANLLVCGDWTACGLPSTLEAAARSAELAVAAG